MLRLRSPARLYGIATNPPNPIEKPIEPKRSPEMTTVTGTTRLRSSAAVSASPTGTPMLIISGLSRPAQNTP